MKRLNLMILTTALFGGVTQAAVKDGVVKYDCRSGRSGTGRYEYTQKQLEKWAKNPRPDAEWRLVERKEPDSVQNKKAQRDTFMRYQKLAEEKLMRLRRVTDLMSCIGKPISDEVDSEIIADLASRPEVMEDRDAIMKDLVKGRISKKCKIYLDDYEADCRVAYEEALYDAECVKDDWLGFYRGKGEPLSEIRMISYVDTVSNPYYYGRVYLDMRENGNWCEYSFREMCCGLSDGWEWLEKENGANDQERIEEFYPHEVTYTRYKSHPQYRIIGNKVFDSEGSLVRIMTPDHDGIVLSSYDYEYGYDESTANDIARQLCVLAYKNNDYNIWSRGLKVNRYIQSKLGLENFERSGSGRYGATSSGAHVNTRDDINYTQEGDAWLKQVRSDYRKFFIDQPPYRCERVNGVTFRMIYADEKANPTYEVIHSYVPTGSYKTARNVKVEKIFDSGLMTQRGIVVTEVEPESEDFILGKLEYDNKVFTSVEQMPQYPGGDAVLLADIDKNIRYPSVAMENGIEGKVVVKFVVTKTGTVGEVKVVRGKDPDLDKEAKRVVKTLKRFDPGKIDGKPVSVWYTLPITFKFTQ